MRLSRRLPIFVVILSMLGCMFPAVAGASQTDISSLSIQDALNMAYKDNPDLRKAELSVEKAQLQCDDAAESVTWIPTGGLVLPAYQQVMNGYQQAQIGLSTAKKTRDTQKESISKDVIAAYTAILKSKNNLDTLKINLEDAKNQKRIQSLAKEVGLCSDYDYSKASSSIEQLEKSYNAAQQSYQGSIASLAALLGKDEAWKPDLSSKVLIASYPRNELSVEISRGTSESTLVWTQKALLDIEKSKESWVLPNLSSDMQNINLSTAEIDYEQAKRSARTSIEQLYYNIDATEGQLQAYVIANAQAQKDLQIAQLKYDLGLLPATSMTGGESLASAKASAQKAQISLDNARADLVNLKAQFAYLTGQTVYDEKDWSSPTIVSANK